MTERQMGAHIWARQDEAQLRQVAQELGVSTVEARMIYDREIARRLHGGRPERGW